jgi:hypothetical protein
MSVFEQKMEALKRSALNPQKMDKLFEYFVEQAFELANERGLTEYECFTCEDDYYHHLCELELLGKAWTEKVVGISLKRVSSTEISFKLVEVPID